MAYFAAEAAFHGRAAAAAAVGAKTVASIFHGYLPYMLWNLFKR